MKTTSINDFLNIKDSIEYFNKHDLLNFKLNNLIDLVLEKKLTPLFLQNNLKVYQNNASEGYFTISGYFYLETDLFKMLLKNKSCHIIKEIKLYNLIDASFTEKVTKPISIEGKYKDLYDDNPSEITEITHKEHLKYSPKSRPKSEKNKNPFGQLIA